MNVFLLELSKEYEDDILMLYADNATWHRAKALEIPDNVKTFSSPPYTPEMNPIENVWKELHKRGFRNEVFVSLEKVVDRLCETILSLKPTI